MVDDDNGCLENTTLRGDGGSWVDAVPDEASVKAGPCACARLLVSVFACSVRVGLLCIVILSVCCRVVGSSTAVVVLTLYLRLHLKRQLHYLRLGMLALFALTGALRGCACVARARACC